MCKPKELDINASVKDMEDLLQRMNGEHVQMVVVLHPDAGDAMMDPVQLQQILMNLAVNVCDAMPDGGLVNIETDRIDLDKQFVRLHPGAMTDSFVKILVQDAGCGMNPETLSHILEPFFTTKGLDKGIGLGLQQSTASSNRARVTSMSSASRGRVRDSPCTFLASDSLAPCCRSSKQP